MSVAPRIVDAHQWTGDVDVGTLVAQASVFAVALTWAVMAVVGSLEFHL